MSLFGKILAVLNIAAAGAFLYLAVMTYGLRQTWSYAVFRYDVALNGLPVDKEDRDSRGRQRYLDVNEALARELTGKPNLVTQEDVLQDLRSDIQNKIESAAQATPAAADHAKVEKYAEVLLPLAQTTAEREALLNARNNPANKDYAKLAERFNAIFDKALRTKDRAGKRTAIAHLMVSLIGVLPTDEEKKQRAEDLKKPLDKRSDPTADPAFRRALNTVGSRALARALQVQARELGEMLQDVEAARNQERLLFIERHQSLLNTMIDADHRLREVTDQVDEKKAQVAIQKQRADDQEALVKKVKGQHDTAQAETVKELEKLAAQQQKLFEVRVRLRDANRINQEMELLVRKLEEEYRSKQR
jgi:hypothetical protein